MSNVVFENDTPFEVFKVLDEMGFQQNLLGYDYLAYAIKHCMDVYPQKPKIIGDVYPSVAKIFDTTAIRVERAIRHSIERAFIRGDMDVMHKYFGNSIHPDDGKVTNAHFMYCVASKLRMKDNMLD